MLQSGSHIVLLFSLYTTLPDFSGSLFKKFSKHNMLDFSIERVDSLHRHKGTHWGVFVFRFQLSHF